jgi:hypothetical protein
MCPSLSKKLKNAVIITEFCSFFKIAARYSIIRGQIDFQEGRAWGDHFSLWFFIPNISPARALRLLSFVRDQTIKGRSIDRPNRDTDNFCRLSKRLALCLKAHAGILENYAHVRAKNTGL